MHVKKPKEYLETLRDLPEHKQKAFAFGVSGFLTFVIVSGSFVSPGSAANILKEEEDAEKKLPSPFALMGKELAGSVSGLWSEVPIDSLKDVFRTAASEKPLSGETAPESSPPADLNASSSPAAATTTPITGSNAPSSAKRPANSRN